MPVVEDDPFGTIKEDKKSTAPTADEVKKDHTHADTDSSVLALHHTLGTEKNQATSGSHTHTGKDSRLLAEGLGLTLTGALTPGSVAQVDAIIDSLVALLKNVIDFSDLRA